MGCQSCPMPNCQLTYPPGRSYSFQRLKSMHGAIPGGERKRQITEEWACQRDEEWIRRNTQPPHVELYVPEPVQQYHPTLLDLPGSPPQLDEAALALLEDDSIWETAIVEQASVIIMKT